jgi:hypothetical protein
LLPPDDVAAAAAANFTNGCTRETARLAKSMNVLKLELIFGSVFAQWIFFLEPHQTLSCSTVTSWNAYCVYTFQ